MTGSGEVLKLNSDATSFSDTFSIHVQTSSDNYDPKSFESNKFEVEASELLEYDSTKTTEDITVSLRKSLFDSTTSCSLECTNCDEFSFDAAKP